MYYLDEPSFDDREVNTSFMYRISNKILSTLEKHLEKVDGYKIGPVMRRFLDRGRDQINTRIYFNTSNFSDAWDKLSDSQQRKYLNHFGRKFICHSRESYSFNVFRFPKDIAVKLGANPWKHIVEGNHRPEYMLGYDSKVEQIIYLNDDNSVSYEPTAKYTPILELPDDVENFIEENDMIYMLMTDSSGVEIERMGTFTRGSSHGMRAGDMSNVMFFYTQGKLYPAFLFRFRKKPTPEHKIKVGVEMTVVDTLFNGVTRKAPIHGYEIARRDFCKTLMTLRFIEEEQTLDNWHIYCDANCVEVSTPPITDLETIGYWHSRMIYVADTVDFGPENEFHNQGTHICVDCDAKIATVVSKVTNIAPGISWAFAFGKEGLCSGRSIPLYGIIIAKGCDTSYRNKYIEFRAPKSFGSEEQLKIACAFYRRLVYAAGVGIFDNFITKYAKQSREDIANTSFVQAVKRLKEVCKLMGFDFDLMRSFIRENMVLRFRTDAENKKFYTDGYMEERQSYINCGNATYISTSMFLIG